MTGPIPWWQDKFVGLDFETTGVDIFNDRIVTAAYVQVRPGARPTTYSWIINPGIPIPTGASDIHGWTTERIAACPTAMDPAQALFEIGMKVAYPLSHGIPLVLFNAPFDLSIFEAECHRHGVPTLAARLGSKPLAPVVDSMVIDKQLSHRRGKRRLGDVCAHYGVTLAGAHNAAADALAAVRLVPCLFDQFPKELATLTAMDLHERQVGWKAKQAASFSAYLRSQGKPADDVSPEWPVRYPTPVQGALA